MLHDRVGTPVQITHSYMSALKSLCDKHTPLLHRSVTVRSASPWYTEDLREEKRRRRHLESVWMRTLREQDRLAYRKQCASMKRTKTL